MRSINKREYFSINDTPPEERINDDRFITVTHFFEKRRLFFSIGVICTLSLWALYVFGGQSVVYMSTVPKSAPFRTVSHPDPPPAYWGTVKKPYPTGAFWTNFVVGNGDFAVGLHPYSVKTLMSGIQISYGAFRRSVTDYSISDIFAVDIQLGSSQSYISRAVESFDNLTVTIAYKMEGGAGFKSPFIKNSPFITVVYSSATPVINTTMKILSFESVALDFPSTGNGIQYLLTLGNYQKWLVYCSENIGFSINGGAIVAAKSFTGVVRVAILPPRNADQSFQMLMKYAARYPIGASVALMYPLPNVLDMEIDYKTVGDGNLLMLALPHHCSLLQFPALLAGADTDSLRAFYKGIRSIKGMFKIVRSQNGH
jgi:endoglucanase Acf2